MRVEEESVPFREDDRVSPPVASSVSAPRPGTPIRRAIGPALIALVFLVPLFVHIEKPFLRHREGVGAYYANLGRNLVREGPVSIRLGLLETSGPDLSVYENWRLHYYPNRPPLGVLLTGLWFGLFGWSETVLRLSLIVAALGALVAFGLLARKLLKEPWATVATALFAFMPIFWYFSIIAVHLVYALAFSLGAWACWVRRDEGRRFLYLTFVFLGLACLSDWPGYFAVLSIAGDAIRTRRFASAGGAAGLALGCFALHLLHLLWIDPEGGPLLERFLRAGAERSPAGLPSAAGYLLGEAREVGLYFTAGGLVLAGIGLLRLPAGAGFLALLGLEEIVFMTLAARHDFLTYPLAPIVALASAQGLAVLWRPGWTRIVGIVLLAAAGAQSAWVMGNRLTRFGAYEVNYQAAVAIREGTRPSDRVLITIADLRQYTPYYADRYTAGVEPSESPRLVVHHSREGVLLGHPHDLERFLERFEVVLVGDPDRAAEHIRFFEGRPPPESFGFLDASHPLRRRLEKTARGRQIKGAYILYRLGGSDP